MAEEERDRKWTALRLRGLRKRWIVNTILPVLVLLVLLVTLVSAGVSTYYYSSMENGLVNSSGADTARIFSPVSGSRPWKGSIF